MFMLNTREAEEKAPGEGVSNNVRGTAGAHGLVDLII